MPAHLRAPAPENKVLADAMKAWRTSLANAKPHERVYGVALMSNGDFFYAIDVRQGIERIGGAGLLARTATPAEFGSLTRAMEADRFQVVQWDARKQIWLRTFPAPSDTWSRKSAHESIGGLGMVSAAAMADLALAPLESGRGPSR